MASPTVEFPPPSNTTNQATSRSGCAAGSSRRRRNRKGKKLLTTAAVLEPQSPPRAPVSEQIPTPTVPIILKPKEEDEWTVVPPRRISRAKQGHGAKDESRSQTQTPEEPVPWTPCNSSLTSVSVDSEAVAKLVHKIRSSMVKLESSDFLRCFHSQLRLHPSINLHLSRWCPERSSAQMVVYGIGSIESYEPPRLQLALAILLHKELGFRCLVEIFDPVLSSTECAAIEELGCKVLSMDERGRRAVVSPILFYMPHCEAILYDNLLSANWDPASLNKLVVLGNSFREYDSLVSGLGRVSKVDGEAKYVVKASRIVKEIRIEEADEGEGETRDKDKRKMNRDEVLFRAFHSTSWHFFNLDDSAFEFDQKGFDVVSI